MKLLLHIHSADLKYVNAVKQYLTAFNNVIVSNVTFLTTAHAQQEMQSKGCDCIATTSLGLMKKFDPSLEGTTNDNLGYLIERDTLRLILIPELKQVYSVPHGGFLIKRFMQKLRYPEKFIAKSPFVWEYVTPHNWESYYEFFNDPTTLAAVDIETEREDCYITHCAYSGIRDNIVRTCVFDLTNWADSNSILFGMAILRKFNASACKKILQNGEYDNTYFIRWNMPVTNWYFDTYNMQHCHYSELPKDLAFISAMYLRNFRFWKDEISSFKAEYNAKDAHNTLFTFIAQMAELEPYAKTNYLLEFPLVFPCFHASNEGLLVDIEERARLHETAADRLLVDLSRLRKYVHPAFNPNSSQQVLLLMQAMGFTSASSTDKKSLESFAERGPLEELLVSLLTSCRKQRKAISTYYEYELYGNRALYKLDPAGTDTGRLASRMSSLWCGTQIQNQPPYCKSMYIADEGWLLCEIDNSQSESRTTAYLSQDRNLMETVETSPDFHCTNASMFFGIPFHELFDISTGQKLNEDIRNLAKRTNHGANYNMGANVLVQTMGTKNIFKAGRLLNLPRTWTAVNIAEYLLRCFDKTYPRVRGAFQQELIHEVRTTGKLVLPNGWTRRTFLQPWKSKPDLNALVAHKPQSLSVQLINAAFKKVWKELQLDKGSQVLRLKAQVHDSLLFQYKIGEDWVVDEVSKMMKIPCTVHGRTFIIPNDIDKGKTRWKEQKL